MQHYFTKVKKWGRHGMTYFLSKIKTLDPIIAAVIMVVLFNTR
jgi:hypothetical protein